MKHSISNNAGKVKPFKAWLLRRLTRQRRDRFDLAQTQSVLVLRYDRIGDMIVTTPLLREMKLAFPHWHIAVLASPMSQAVLHDNPYVDAVYVNHKHHVLRDLAVLWRLRRQRFDVCVELDHSVVMHAIVRLRLLRPRAVVALHKDGRYGVPGSELALYDRYSPRSKDTHFRELWANALTCFARQPASLSYDLFPSVDARSAARELALSYPGRILIGVNLKGSIPEKHMSLAELAQLAQALQAHEPRCLLLVITTPAERAELARALSTLAMPMVQLAYATASILDAAALLSECHGVVTPDTSIVHVAGALDKPVVSIHENNRSSYTLWQPVSSWHKTVFAPQAHGLRGYDVNQLIDYTIAMVAHIQASLS